MQNETIQLAIQALEAEQAKVQQAIAELKAGLNAGSAKSQVITGGGEMPTPFVTPPSTRGRKGKRRMSAAARKALSESAKRRWAKAKKLGKSTL